MVIFNILMAILCIMCGIFAGLILSSKATGKVQKRFRMLSNAYDGIFRVNTSDPEKDVFTLELDCAIGSIPEKDELIFKVENVGSQEKPSL